MSSVGNNTSITLVFLFFSALGIHVRDSDKFLFLGVIEGWGVRIGQALDLELDVA